ncbi:MAG: hypothetical protein IMZ44_00040 [Planctomycetes bacterium]|nr:hypothetical protein [Planctomycetota bacterium]
MRRVVQSVIIASVAAGAVALGQTGDVTKVLAEARAALGGEKKLAAVKTFAATGLATRVMNEQSSPPADAELAFELPDRFMKKDVLATLGAMTITRTSGFNGDAAINIIDQPPPMPGAMVVFRTGPGGAPGELVTSDQQEAARKAQLLANRQDFARLTLGVLLASPAAYPLQFAYGGQAESPDGKADIVEVKGEGGFAARLFVDTATHLPLMVSWMAKEPLTMTQVVKGGPGGAPMGHATAGGGAVINSIQIEGGKPLTPEDREKLMKQLEEQRKEAEAKRRIVEFRLYYGDYREVDGIMVPFKLQRSVDGKPTEELTLEKVRINGKIDPKKFDVK